jgi:hypothetical protein
MLIAMAILLQPRDTFPDHYKSSLQAHQDTWEHFTPLLHRSSSTHSTPTIQAPPHAIRHHDHARTLHQARHLQFYWHWAAVASPTMCLLTSVPTTEAPHIFHHQLEHCHCLFITPVSVEQQLPHLNNRSYTATTASSPEPAMLAKRWSSQL